MSNPTCTPAKALVTLPSADGGIYGALPAALGLPTNILQAFTPSVETAAIKALRDAVSESGLVAVDPVCAARCAEGATRKHGA